LKPTAGGVKPHPNEVGRSHSRDLKQPFNALGELNHEEGSTAPRRLKPHP
jgi:hypothetical protein